MHTWLVSLSARSLRYRVKRFVASQDSAASDRAERPVPSSNRAGQPVRELRSLAEVQRFLSAGGHLSSSVEVQRLHEAVSILTRKPKPRQQDVWPLRTKWKVQCKTGRQDRPLPVIIQELTEKVMDAANRLQSELPVSSSAEQPALASSSVDSGPDIPRAE